MLLAALLLAGCGGDATQDLGTEDGRLKPCPNTPNCVSTQAAPDDAEHRMESIAYRGDAKEAVEAVTRTIEESPRARITEKGAGYVRAEFTSRTFRFVDDVEYVIDEKRKLIHFRSASRLGSSDTGVNRDRMTALRKDLRPKLNQSERRRAIGGTNP